MNHHPDEHLALAIHQSYPRPQTTAEVADRVDQIIDEFVQFRGFVKRIAAIAGIALVMALAAGIGVVMVIR